MTPGKLYLVETPICVEGLMFFPGTVVVCLGEERRGFMRVRLLMADGTVRWWWYGLNSHINYHFRQVEKP